MAPSYRFICCWALNFLIISIEDLSGRREFFVRAINHEMVDVLGISAAELIRLRGFNAEDHYFTTSDGYILNIVRANNPLINNGKGGLENKSVILVVHGTLTNAKCFVIKSTGAYPADYSEYDAGSMSKEELLEITSNNTSRFSIVFTALNFGHEVWLLNRRGTQYSQGHVNPKKKAYLPTNSTDGNNSNNSFNVSRSEKLIWNLSEEEEQELKKNLQLFAQEFIDNYNYDKDDAYDDKNSRFINPNVIQNIIKILLKPNLALSGLPNTFNPKYWDFSIDEQGLIDVPDAVDYVRKQTGRDKIIYLGHSAGAAMALMGLSVNKTLNHNLLKTILWAPALDLGASTKLSIIDTLAPYFILPLHYYVGGIPPTLIVPLLQKLLALICDADFGMSPLCVAAFDLLFGRGGSQETIVSGDFTIFLDSVSSHELAQLAQFVRDVISHRYDYENVIKNIEVYGTFKPPVYNLSAITAKGLSYWYGATDGLVEVPDIRLQLAYLKVPVEEHFFNMPGVYINHASYFFQKKVDQLIVIPTLQTIESK